MRNSTNLILAIALLPSALSFAMTRPRPLSPRVSKLQVLRGPLRALEGSTAAPDTSNHFRLDQPAYVPSHPRLIDLDSITSNVKVVSVVSGVTLGSLLGGRVLIRSLQKISTPPVSHPRDPLADGLDRFIPYGLRVANAKVRHTLGAIRSRLVAAVVGNGRPVDLNKWNTAVLSAVSKLPGGYVKYRFRLDSSSGYLPLDVGQEVIFYFNKIFFNHIQRFVLVTMAFRLLFL